MENLKKPRQKLIEQIKSLLIQEKQFLVEARGEPKDLDLLDDLLSRTVMTSSVGGVQVLIGGENTWDELRQCSVILARYGVPDTMTGTLGVLGPMRMSYGNAISTVRFVAGLLSDLVSDTLVE